MTMRAVSFVNRLSMVFSGNMFASAICLGDVDNDNDYELVLGNVSGDLAIFKGGPFVDPAVPLAPWKSASELGTITCLGVGDLFQSGSNVLVVINAIGQLSVFALEQQQQQQQPSTSVPSVSTPGAASASGAASGETLRPLLCIKVPINIKSMLIADVDGDGRNELVVGRTDRVVHIFRWETEVPASTPAAAAASTDANPPSAPASSASPATAAALSAECLQRNVALSKGRLVSLHKCDLPGQLGSMSIAVHPLRKSRVLVVSQPGGTFVSIESDGRVFFHNNSGKTSLVVSAQHENARFAPKGDLSLASSASVGDFASKKHEPARTIASDGLAMEQSSSEDTVSTTLGTVSGSALGASTEVVAGIKKSSSAFDPLQSVASENDGSETIALCTLDGSLKFMEFDQPAWELQVDHQLFALCALDITSPVQTQDRPDRVNSHIVTCAWDGMTYIVDGNRNAVRFQFEEGDVCAFAAGYFAVERGKSVPVLCYVTFTDQVLLYYNLGLEFIQDRRLLEDMLSSQDDQALFALLSSHAQDGERLTREQCASVVSACLYSASLDELRHLYEDLKRPQQ